MPQRVQQENIIKFRGELDQAFHKIPTNMSNKMDLLVILYIQPFEKCQQNSTLKMTVFTQCAMPATTSIRQDSAC
jgi:hypothetical protein